MATNIKDGVFWSAVERFSTQGCQFLLSIFIARLVLPEEYGLVAMLTIFLSVTQIFVDSGFSYALLQKKTKDESDFSTAFIVNVLLSLFAYGLFFCIAPIIAHFYEEPRLTIICRFSFVVLIINSFSSIQGTRLVLRGAFRLLTKISLISVISSGLLGVFLAYKGYGVWALVFQSIASSIINCFLLWIVGEKMKEFVFSKESFNSLFGFGSKILCTSLLDTMYTNLYNLAIGKVYRPTELGYYNRAYTFSQFPSRNIYNICSRVIFPKLSEMQNDGKNHVDFFCKYIRMLCYIIFPLMIGLSALAKPFVVVTLTEKWLPCADYISILAIAYMLFPLMNAHFDFVNSLGYSNYSLQAEIIKKVAGFSILLITLWGGVKLLCYGLIIANILDIVIMVAYAKRISSYNYSRLVKEIIPILLIVLPMGIVVHIVAGLFDNPIISLFVGGVLGSLFYIGLSYIFKIKEIKILQIITR